MFTMFNQAFASITVLFAALENLAKALFHISTTAEQKAHAFAQEAAIENEAKLKALKQQLALSAPAITATIQP
jgi:hypothetical protein